MIVDHADLGRRTFYRYFKTKDDALKYITELLMNQFTDTVIRNNSHGTKVVAIAYFQFWEQYIDILLLLKKAHFICQKQNLQVVVENGNSQLTILWNTKWKIEFSKKKYFKGESNKQRQVEGLKCEVFNEEDIKKIKKIALKDFLDNPNHSTSSASLGVLLLFCTGLRVGELVAIRTSNIYDDYIWIEEEEQRDYIISIDEKTQKVKCTYNGTKVGKAKTSASFRKVDLTNEAKQIIEMVRNANKENGFKDEDFLFVNATQRMQENTILKRIYKFCDEAFIEKRSPHKVRKTFASILVNDGIMDISEVAQLLGHVSEQTLINHYLYPTKSSETRRERLEKALAM